MLVVHHRRWVVLALLGLVVAFACADISWAQPPLPANVESYVKSITDELDQAGGIAHSLRTRANVSIWLNVIAGVLGLVGGTLPNIRKPWATVAAGVIGVVVGTTTIVNNNVYGVDSAVLKENADELDEEVINMRSHLSTIALLDPKNENDLRTWESDTQRKRGDFEERRAQLRKTTSQRNGSTQRSRTGGVVDLFPAALAQTAAQKAPPPSWVTRNPTQDDTFLYFVATQDGPSLTDAKDMSTREAYGQAVKYLAEQARTCPIGLFREHATNAAKVADTFFDVRTAQGSNERVVHYSTLLKLNKALADRGLLETLTAGKTTKVQQGNVWTPSQFGGAVGVYVGIGPQTLPVVVFTIPAGDRQWESWQIELKSVNPGIQPPGILIADRYNELKKKLSPKQILQDVKLKQCENTTFQLQGKSYDLSMMEVQVTEISTVPSARLALAPASAPVSQK